MTNTTDSTILAITDCGAGTHWSGTSCAVNSCPGGFLTSSYPTCDQCPDGQYYKTSNSQCTSCGGTGCTGVGGTISNPIPSTLSCRGGATNPIACNVFAPACSTLSVSKSSLSAGDTVKLTWACQNVSSCAEIANADGFSTGGRVSGSDSSVTPSASSGQVIYGLTCGGSSFYFPPITILVPTVSIKADPTRVKLRGSSTISWDASNVKSCTISGPGLSRTNYPGQQSIVITATSIFTITCQTNGSPVSQSATVNAGTVLEEF